MIEMLKINRPTIFFGLLLAVGIGPIQAQGEMVVYPTKGQTPEQTSADRGECHEWAVQQSGFNPVETTTNQERSAIRGGARGAAAGAAIGAIAGDAGKGAAIGATAGGMKGGFQRRDQKRAAKAGAAAYDQALRACLEGRGYSVK